MVIVDGSPCTFQCPYLKLKVMNLMLVTQNFIYLFMYLFQRLFYLKGRVTDGESGRGPQSAGSLPIWSQLLELS